MTFVGLRRAEFAGTLVPATGLVTVGAHALHVKAGKLHRIEGGGEADRSEREAGFSGALEEQTRGADVALLLMP